MQHCFKAILQRNPLNLTLHLWPTHSLSLTTANLAVLLGWQPMLSGPPPFKLPYNHCFLLINKAERWSRQTKPCHYGMRLVLSVVEPFIHGFCWLMGFCFLAVSRSNTVCMGMCMRTAKTLFCIQDTSANQHNCTNCGQFLGEWTPLSNLTTSGGTRTSHGPPKGDERGVNKKKYPVTVLHSVGWTGL